LPVLLVAGLPAVTVAITRGSPTPETTALLLFFADGTFTGCIYDGIVVANGAWYIKVGGWRRRELRVEGVENTDRCRGTPAILLAFSSVLIVR
jgi:hypothetical protein